MITAFEVVLNDFDSGTFEILGQVFDYIFLDPIGKVRHPIDGITALRFEEGKGILGAQNFKDSRIFRVSVCILDLFEFFLNLVFNFFGIERNMKNISAAIALGIVPEIFEISISPEQVFGPVRGRRPGILR